ncbi:sulfatase [Streptomyces sp. Je 1-332]|uniref:sulfatase family protein n=1 Tax=Streptomyces sp. Je 1-332 TaxID=3231270 RepID=UPI003458641E
MTGARRRPTLLAAWCAVLAVLMSSCSSGAESGPSNTSTNKSASQQDSSNQQDSSKPNIVYVLTDDLSSNLVQYMPHVRKMQEEGASLSNFFVTDSLCCPSRSTILTGDFPHNTGVFTNTGDDGGYGAFMKNGNEKRCYAPKMQDAGYRTGFMGKYLNGYQPAEKKNGSKGYVPPGWDEWAVAGNGYPEFDYDLNENGTVRHYGKDPEDYLTDVISDKAGSFIDASAKEQKPFMLQLSPFTPHGPATPAPRDADSYPHLKAPRTEAYDRATEDAPQWQRELAPLTEKEQRKIDQNFAKRVRSVQAIDTMIGRLQEQLKAKGMADNTYFMFSSDNGFHMGEHRLRPGKQTAYDTDIKVPMTVTGPGVPAGTEVDALTQNTDLNPTFLDLAGVTPDADTDGQSFADLLRGKSAEDGREAVLIEHRRSASKKHDPDAGPEKAGNPPTYEAIRTPDELYVEYATGEREYYDLKADPLQLKNTADALSEERREQLHGALARLKACDGAEECKKAAQLDGT